MLFPGRSWKAMRWWRLSNPLAPQLHERIWHVLNAEYHRSVVHEYIAQRASRYRGHWHCWPRALLILQTDLVLLKELLTSRGAFLEPRRSRWWASGKCCLMLNDPCWGSFCSILQHFGRFCKWKLGWSQWPHQGHRGLWYFGVWRWWAGQCGRMNHKSVWQRYEISMIPLSALCQRCRRD